MKEVSLNIPTFSVSDFLLFLELFWDCIEFIRVIHVGEECSGKKKVSFFRLKKSVVTQKMDSILQLQWV